MCSAQDWCRLVPTVEAASAYHTYLLSLNLYLTLNGLDFRWRARLLSSALVVCDDTDAAAAGVAVAAALCHSWKSHFQHMNNSIWFLSIFIHPRCRFNLNRIRIYRAWVCMCVCVAHIVDIMPIGWKFHRNKFFYFTFRSLFGIAQVLTMCLYIFWMDYSNPWNRNDYKCLWCIAEKLMDQMLRLEYFMQIN